MAEGILRLVVRTPRGVALDAPVRSLRVPTDTGQVGIRPRTERGALVVEPGLCLCRTDEGVRFLGTAGGLLRKDRERAVLLTPAAAAGSSPPEAEVGLAAALRGVEADRALRNELDRLERALAGELRARATRGSAPPPSRRRLG